MIKVRKKQPRVIYPGSTIPQNYSEDSIKGFLLWDIQDKDEWTVDFHPVAHKHPFVTVEWQGNVDKTFQKCIETHPSEARYRIKHKKTIDPKTQKSLAKKLTAEADAFEVVFKLENNQNYQLSERTNNKLQVFNLSQPQTHKNLLREYAEDETITDELWVEIDNVIDNIVPQLQFSVARNQKWSIKQMKFNNTFGYGPDNVINFEKLNGVVGLFGPNRAGKSSIPGSLMYGLFNSNDRGLTSNQHIINYRAKDADCHIDFSVNENLYRLERYSQRLLSRGKETAVTYLNLFEIDEGGNVVKDLSGEQRRDTEKALKSLIGSSDEFMMTSFAAQGNMDAFIKKGATDRKKLLSSFMGLDIFDDINKLIKEESAYIKGAMKRNENKDWKELISKSEKIIETTEIKNQSLQVSIADKKEDLEKLKKQADKDYDFIDPVVYTRAEQSLNNDKNQIIQYNTKLVELDIEIDAVQTRLEKFEEIENKFPIENLKRRLESLENLERNFLKMKNTLDKEQRKLDAQNHSIKLLKEVPCGDQFPSCKFIAESHKNKQLLGDQRQLVKDLKFQLAEVKEELSVLEEEGLKNKISRYENMLKQKYKDQLELEKYQSKFKHIEHLKSQLELSIPDKEQKLLALKLKLNQELSDNSKELQKLILNIAKDISSMENEYVINIKSIGNHSANIETFKREQEQFEKLKIEWEVYEFLLRATSWKGIPTYVMSKQIPTINNELSSILSDVTGFTLELVVDEKNTDIYINYGDSVRPIECGSGMEKMVSSMALRVAMSNVSSLSKSDMFIVDEGFGALDGQNIEAVTSLLHRLKNYYKLILVISHVDVIKDNVDDIITIGRKNNNSFVKFN